jgi:hypothetical protein
MWRLLTLKAFGMDNGIKDLQPFVMNDLHNWRSQNSTEETRAMIREYFSEDMNPYDAAALCSGGPGVVSTLI